MILGSRPMASPALPESSISSKNIEKETNVKPRESELQKEDEKGNRSLTLPVEDKGILERYTETSIFQMLSPLIINMKIVGLSFVRHYPEKSDHGGASCGTKCPTRSQVYATVCYFFYWARVIQSLLVFNSEEHFGNILFGKIMYGLGAIFACTNATVLYLAFHRADCLPELFIYWDGLHGEVSQERIKYVKKRVVVCVVLSWLIILSSVAYIAFGMFFTTQTDFDYLKFFPKDGPYLLILRCVLVVGYFFTFSAWIFPICLMCGIFTGLYMEFRVLNKDIASVIGDKTALESAISGSRSRHQNLCTLVEKADRPVNLLLANSFVMNTACLCILVYSSVSARELQVFTACWIILSTLSLGVSSVGAALVNSQVSITRISIIPLGRFEIH